MDTAPTQILIRRIVSFGLVTVAADETTKLAAHTLAAGHTSGALVPVRTHDFTLGLAHASVPVMVIVMAIGIIALGSYLLRATLQGQVPAWATGLLIGGAVSNLADRLTGGSVRDFLATPWVVLDLADLAVVAGLAGWLIHQHHSTRIREEVTP